MKFKLLASAALLAGVCSTPAVPADTAPAAAPAPATVNVAAATNANPAAAMAALFGDPVIVKAKGYEIKRSELDQMVSAARINQAAANQPVSRDTDVLVLEQLITIQSLLQKATPADEAAGKVDAHQQYTNLVAQFRSEDEFKHMLTAKGLAFDEYQKRVLQETTARAVVKRELNINITDDEARAFYNQHPADFEQPEQVHAQHILLLTIDPSSQPPLPLSTNMVAAKRKQIEDLRKRVVAGEDFATLAKQYSEDPGSKANGGELPLFSRGKMVPEFEAAAFALNTNQVSEIVTSQYGFHLIKVLEKIPAKKIDFATAGQDIKDFLGQKKLRKLLPDYMLKLRQEEGMRILDDALKAKDEQVQANQAAAAAEAAEAEKAESVATNAPAAGAAK